jgi:hypothetical protein
VTVTCGNDAPVVDLDGPADDPGGDSDVAANFTEGTPVVIVDAVNLTVSDPDSPDLASATVTITNLLDAGIETLAAVTAGTSITAVYTAATGVLSLTGPDTLANYQQVLRTVMYNNTSQNPNTTARLITFVVNDGTDTSATATTTLSITSVNNPPTVTPVTFTLDENSTNGTVVGTVTATDPDLPAQTLSYAITAGNTGNAFAINASTGQITVATSTALDFETTPTFNLTVQVTDDGTPAQSGSATITVNLNNVNDPPVVTAATFSVAENSANGTAVGTPVTFTDTDVSQTHTFAITAGNTGNAFAINSSTGQITVANGTALDFETTPTFGLTVQVIDDGTPAQSGSATITVNLTNVNEAPVPTGGPFSLPENSANGISVGTVSAGDLDAGQTQTFSITAGNTGSAFAINASTGQIAVATSGALNFETTPSFTLTVQVMDNGTPNLTGTTTITITLTDVNEAPVIDDQSVSLTENSANGTTVATVPVSDPDTAQTHTFSFTGGNTGGAFAISNTGVITVAAVAAVNFEVNPVFTLTVQVTDSGTPTLSDTATVMVNLLNVNEAPVAQDKNYSAQANMQIGIADGNGLLIGATDEDAGTVLTVSAVSGTTPAGGNVTFNAATGAFDVDPPPGVTGNVTFTYTVQDNGMPTLSDTATVTVNVSGPVIWFVQQGAAGTNDGRLSNPFTALGSVPAVDSVNDRVFVFAGTYVDGLALLSGEQLIGQGVTGADFDTLFGITPPVGTIARPAINGTRPVLQNTVTLNTSGVVRGLNLSTTNATALTDVAGATTGVSVNEVDVLATTATAVSFNDLAGTVALGSTTSTGGTTNVSLTSVAATVNLGSGALSGSTAGASNHAFVVSGGTGVISYAGNITKANQGNLINVSGKTGGTVTFSGALNGNGSSGINVSNHTAAVPVVVNFTNASQVLNTGASPAVTLDNNDTATINFTGGGLAITTTSGTGFNAINGAEAINVTGSNNTITSGTGTALNVNNSIIGGSGLTFRSIAANGGTNGIVLNTTGALGGLTVTGNGGLCTSAAMCTGGAIQSTTSDGIVLTNTRNVSLTRVYIANTGRHGVNGTQMTDASGGILPTFALLNSFMESPGDADNESALFFDTLSATNITGTMVVSDTTIQNFEDVGIHIGNQSGTLTLNVTNVTINNNSDTNGEEGIDVDASGTATINVNISNSRFQDLEGGSMNIVAQMSGTIDLNVNNIVDIGAGGPDNFPTPPVMTFSAEGPSSNFFFDITNNKLLDAPGDGIFIGHEGEISGRITGNVITGIALGDGIRIDTDATSNQLSTILIENNQIGTTFNFESVNHTGVGDDGIQVLHRDGTKTLNLTINNNQIANTGAGQGEALRYFTDDDVAGGGPGNLLKVTNNTFTNIGLPDAIVIITQDPGTDLCTNISTNTFVGANKNIFLSQAGTSVLQITQASVAALAAANTNATASSTGTITFNGTCTNPLLPTNP